MLGKNLIKAAAGNVGGEGIEDLFQTWLYTGNGSTQTITNGIDLAGEGGMVWVKHRAQAVNHALYDTARGATKSLFTNTTGAEFTRSDTLTAFNANGFTLGADTVYNYVNNAGFADNRYASWTFRKAPKFFDVVTYTGTGVARTIAHNLGSVPGCIIVKRLDTLGAWITYHRSLTAASFLQLESTVGSSTSSAVWNNTEPDSSNFTVGSNVNVNASGGTYVAYLFAHDAGGFGDSGNESVIKCGSYVGNGSTNGPVVDLGWEPQWVMVKNASSAGNWGIHDAMRGFAIGSGQELSANLANAESSTGIIEPTSTSFRLINVNSNYNANANAYIYIAIRRGPMKTPTDATKVFGAQTANQAGTGLYVDTGTPLDMVMLGFRGGSTNNALTRARLTASNFTVTSSTAAEVSNTAPMWQTMRGAGSGSVGTDTTTIGWGFRRAPGFFDVVAYTGTGVARTVPHNLGVAPELIICKSRSNAVGWRVYDAFNGATKGLLLNDTAQSLTSTAYWNDTTPTSTVFTVGDNATTNASGYTYIAYLFATCPGISKVGSYTGNGSSQTINCGFTAGSRFVLIKRTDSTGNWLVADTARGIVSGNDPLLYLNSTAAEITTLDWIDPDSSGFIVNQEATANANVNGATYIYLSVA